MVAETEKGLKRSKERNSAPASPSTNPTKKQNNSPSPLKEKATNKAKMPAALHTLPSVTDSAMATSSRACTSRPQQVESDLWHNAFQSGVYTSVEPPFEGIDKAIREGWTDLRVCHEFNYSKGLSEPTTDWYGNEGLYKYNEDTKQTDYYFAMKGNPYKVTWVMISLEELVNENLMHLFELALNARQSWLRDRDLVTIMLYADGTKRDVLWLNAMHSVAIGKEPTGLTTL